MTTSFADGLSEEEFRRSIEARLRENRPEEAVRRLRRLLAADAGPGRILPARFLSVDSPELVLHGWEELGIRMRAHDEPGRPITAISIAFAWPGENPPMPDERGHLRPLIEVEYFNDAAYPFSESDRDNLLEGYSYYGCTWAGEGKATEPTLSVSGIDDLHGALAQLEARLLAMDVPDEDEIRAGSLGACLLSVLMFQAVRDRLASDPLPRPVCVMAGSNGVYPYFDAPVAGMPEQALKDEAAELAGAAAHVPGPRYSSLLVTGIPRARKRAVLVVDETESETAARIASLRGLHHVDPPVPAPALEPLAGPVPELAGTAVPEDGAIIPNPDGPLMVKKKPAHTWDFRDLLTTEPPLREPDCEPGLPGPEGEAGRNPPPRAPEPPVSEPEPVAVAPQVERRIEPGFTSFEIDLDIESRLKALIAAQALPPEPVPDPEARAVPQPDVGPAWPLGIGWLEDPAEPETAEACSAPPSLLTRLLNLLPWRR